MQSLVIRADLSVVEKAGGSERVSVHLGMVVDAAVGAATWGRAVHRQKVKCAEDRDGSDRHQRTGCMEVRAGLALRTRMKCVVGQDDLVRRHKMECGVAPAGLGRQKVEGQRVEGQRGGGEDLRVEESSARRRKVVCLVDRAGSVLRHRMECLVVRVGLVLRQKLERSCPLSC